MRLQRFTAKLLRKRKSKLSNSSNNYIKLCPRSIRRVQITTSEMHYLSRSDGQANRTQ
ncbi:hypothetical protein NIES2104_61060 [Leptolyngbya sp. NIES-2104]|nr:hypothetical protein NIES2104_61060 [Leptolyngbya sp. NIES-2104]